jgi:hypothetical protein
MRAEAVFMLNAGLFCASSACTLLIDRDGLTRGDRGGTAGAAGVTPTGGSGASAGTSAGGSNSAGNSGDGGTPGAAGSASANGGAPACSPSDADIYCDGLDQACAPTLVDEGCSEGCTGITLNAVSYMGCTISSTFDQAETRCQAQRMHLVKIDSPSENAFVVQLAEKLGSYVWIGGSNRTLISTFAWTDGTAFYRDGAAISGVYQNFGPDQPVSDPTRACVQIHSDTNGHWSNTRCSDSEQFVCERF